MIFKDWTYRKKNKALFGMAAALLFISWFMAFGKTFELIQNYKRLKTGLDGREAEASNNIILDQKAGLQDSLLNIYIADSTLWVSGLLQNVGAILSTQAVGVSFENKSVGINSHTVERDVVLNGTFSGLQNALISLEKKFFIKSIHGFVENDQLKYRIRMVAIKK